MSEGAKRPVPLVVALDMGYGHMRAASPLAKALGTSIVEVDRAPLAGAEEAKLWRRTRFFYELTSRLSQLRFGPGAPLRRLLAEREHDLPCAPLAFAGTPLPRRPLLPQPWVTTTDGARVRLDDLLGAGFALIGLGLSPRAWARPSDLPLWMLLTTRAVHVVPSAEGPARGEAPWPEAGEGEVAVRDAGALSQWIGRDEVVLVVRPDRHLFGVYGPEEGARAAAALREALGLR